MSDSDLHVLERKLRALPPLLNVPPALAARSLTTGAEEPAPRGKVRRWRPAGVAVAACALTLAAAALALRAQHTPYHRIADLAGAGGASGTVAVGPSGGSTEPVVVSIAHLPPARTGSYYEISFQTTGKPVPGAVFNVAPDGTAVVHLNAPAHTRWVRCWVTRRSPGDGAAGPVVMTST